MKFLTYFNQYVINEELDKELSDMLNTPGFASDKIDNMIKAGHTETGKGSSRSYFKLKTPKKIILDGQEVSIPHGVKISRPNNLDSFHTNESFGKTQNKNEASSQYSPHAVIVPHPSKEGEFITNPHGVLAPVFSHNKTGSWLEMGHVTPMSEKSHDERYKLMHDDDFPNTTHDNVITAINHFEALKQNSNHEIHPYYKQILRKHKLAKGISYLVAHTDLCGYDLPESNWGVWKHPITGKEHPVVLDYGGSTELLKNYNTARINRDNYNKKQLSEELHPIVKSKLDDDYMTPLEKSLWFEKSAHNFSGYTTNSGSGTDRTYVKHNKDKPINLDGHDVQIPIGTKIANVPYSEKHYGLLQNKSETDSSLEPYYVINHSENNNYHTNKEGILLPVMHKSKDGVYHDMAHADPLNHRLKADKLAFNKLTVSDTHPEGLDFNEMFQTIHGNHMSSIGRETYHDKDILNHPLVKKINHLFENTHVHYADLSNSFNWGVWKHPVTGKEHPVILDYGVTKEIMKDFLENNH